MKNIATKGGFPSGAAAWADALRDAKRDIVLRAARDEFIDKGLEGATMRGIALRAGCTTGAVYPLFDSKEALYAALVGQSLQLLDAAVADAIANVVNDAGEDAGNEAAQVRAGCTAFVDYYLRHEFEVNLGLYAFRGLKRQGVGKASDRALNDALQSVLERIGTPLAIARGESAQATAALVALLFSQMIGALVLELAGRLELFDTDASKTVSLMLDQILPVAHKKKTAKAKT